MATIMYSRRTFFAVLIAAATVMVAGSGRRTASAVEESDDAALMKRFEFLSQNGNSNCSGAFMASIATMSASARLQGSCCAPMDAHRYIEQVKTLRKYGHIPEIPSDPYDVEAGTAQRLMPHYDLALTIEEQPAYDYAMANSDEKGPCCCGCWRWRVYGGLAKNLIRDQKYTGAQVVEVWNLSNGCGGGAEHHHG